MDPKRYDEMRSSDRLPSPKGAALRVMELCRQENVALTEIVRTLNTDPGLAGQVIKLANSPVYARPRPVVALSPDIIISIGIQTLRQMVLAFSLISANRKGECREFDYEAFWSRSAATALAANNLGALVPVAPHAELFTCGLLSGVGRLGLATVYPDDYSDLLARSRGCGDDGLLELERRTFSLDHNQLTAAMMLDWGIPKLFSETVLLHEGPDDCGFAVGSRAYSLVYLLHLASRLAASCFMADHERSAQLPRLFATAEKIGITPEQLVRLGDRMLDEWRDWSRLLQLHIHDDVEPFSSLDALSSGVHDDFADPDFARGIRLLIADDDAALVMLLSKKIASLGYTVYTAADGRQALEQIAAHAPHMVLSDVLMPEIDGIELCRTLRRRLEGRGVYFILLTAHKEKGHLVEAFQAGADDFVIKPVTVPALLGRLAAGTRIVRLQAKLEAEQARLHGEDAAGAGEMLDRISGLPSRRYAMIRLKEQWALAERNNVPFSCLRVSLGWKGGHDPEQLKTLLPHAARLLREASRAEDVICHFGEGQFFIVSPHSVLSTAMHFGERLLVRLAEMPATADGAALCVAIGATARSTAVRDEMQLLRLAEAALAQAVERGGGRAVSAMADEEAPGGVVFN